MAERMAELASRQPGFLGVESGREDIGITVFYCSDMDSIKRWRENIDHQEAQKIGFMYLRIYGVYNEFGAYDVIAPGHFCVQSTLHLLLPFSCSCVICKYNMK
jgi:heme-degrading monooxygenase HmoA